MEDFHTYYVSEQKVLVHNTCPRTNISNNSNASASKPIAEVKKPYTDSRPSFRKGVVEQVWENAKDMNGVVHDPNTGEIIEWISGTTRNGVWDMGHIPGQKYVDIHAKYIRGEMSKKEFLDWYNNPKNYRPELPKNNRSHTFE